MLEYRVLGALRVLRDGEELHVGGARQRRLLSVLLLHGNEVVSTDRVAEAVFEGAPTARAATTLRTYVLRLRRVLEQGDSGPVLVTEPPGYRLDVSEDVVDVSRFEALGAEGRSLLEQGDPAGAAALLEKALALWSGEPYAEFAGESWVLTESQRLWRLRSVIEERLIAAELDNGRAAELVGPLEVMVERDPLRETSRRQLMLALYRSGRQADALGVLRDYRDLLGRETGLDPSPQLQRLEQQILVHDEELRHAATSARVVRGYRLGERLGSGRDGTVHAVRLPGVDRDLVIRIAPPEVADRPDVVRSFDATMRRVAALHHEAIVPVDDHWREPGGAYVVLRRMRGGTLRDRLADGGLRSEEVVDLARRIGAALGAAHEAGVTHGRVIAESVLFDESGSAYLSDFPLGEVDGGPGGDTAALVELVRTVMDGHSADADLGSGTAGPRALRDVSTSNGPPTLDEFVARVEQAVGVASPDAPPANPYKGLRAFDEADQADFFGREQLVAELVARLDASGIEGRLVLVVGASGSGKSSVVRAGLLPSVRAGAVTGSERWLVTTMVPGPDPFGELAESLDRVATAPPPDSDRHEPVDAAVLRRTGLAGSLPRVVPEGSELLLVVDQLEELFTLADQDAQRAFLEQLVTALQADDSRLRVVATLRADFYDRPLRFRGFGGLVRDATVTVPAMSAAQLEATIKGPADRVGLEVEPPLVAELVAAVVDQPAAMPSLQFTLYELAADGQGRLDLDAYRQLGGVGGAIAARAEELYGSIDGGDDVIWRLFEQLVVIGPGGEPTRRPVTMAELAHLAVDGDIGDVIEPWVEARLLQRDRHPETREPTVEVAHEALLREWPRLRAWIEADRAAIVAAAQLRDAARSWEALDRDPGALHRGAKLDAVLRQLGARTDTLPPATRAFLDASVAARDQRRARDAERAEQQARTNRRLRRQLAALAAATVVALAGGIVALDQRQQALDQRQQALEDRRLAEARELAAAADAVVGEDAELAILLALEGVERARDAGRDVLPSVERALHRAVTSSRTVLHVQGIGGSVAWHPDGTVFVTEGPEGSGLVDIRDARTGESVRAWTGHDADINDVAFSHDGSLLATAGDDGLLRVWATDSGELESEVAGRGQVWGPQFSPDGGGVAAGWSTEGTVRILQVDNEESTFEIPLPSPPLTDSLSFAPDGQRLAIASHDGVVVVATADGEQLYDFGRPRVEAVAWSPDGRWIASAARDAAPQINNATTGELHAELPGYTSPVYALGWNADSSLLATGALDGEARVLEITDGRSGATLDAPVERLRVAAREGPVWSLDFGGAGGSLLLTGDAVSTSTRVWDVGTAGGAEWANVPTPRRVFSAAAFTPDGRSLLVTGRDEAVTLWDATSGLARSTLGDDRPPSRVVAVSPDGELVATVGSGDPVQVWDLASGEQEFEVTVPGLTPENVAWSPDGELFAVAGRDRRAAGRTGVFDHSGAVVAVFEDEELDRTGFDVTFAHDGGWLVATRGLLSGGDTTIPGVRVRSWPDGELVADLPVLAKTIAASPTGQVVAAAAFTGAVELWDPSTPQRLATLTGHTGEVNDIAFSADGALVATAGRDGTVRVWSADTGLEQVVLQGHDGPVDSVAFGPDGGRLVSTGNGVARVWALDIDDLVTIAKSRLTRSFTDAECRQYLHTETCPSQR